MKINDRLKYVFRAVPGILFLFSATAKLIGIDAFEIYIFSFGWFPLGTAYLLARLVIAAEYSLGILLLANFCPRLAFRGSLSVLAGFTLFLLWLVIMGRRDNCNCFGELVNLNPAASILKNLLLFALLLPSAGLRAFRFRYKPIWLTLAIVIPLAAVLIVSPPDNWRYDAYARHELVNEQAFAEAVEQGILPRSVIEGEHVVCFYSLKCRFCKMSAQKLVPLRERGEFSQAPVIVVFGRGENTDTGPFFEESGLQPDEVHFIDPGAFLRITNGSFPVILIMRDSTVAGKYNYRNLH